jgi:preprotein translocase subunit SecB
MKMTTEKRKSKLVSDAYPVFLSALELYRIALVRSTCRVNREEYLKVEDADINFRLSSTSRDIQETHFDACSTLRLNVRSEKTRALQLWVSATYELHFHGDSPLAPKFIKRFCESEIKLIVWPYFREYIGNISSRMHIPPFILPLQGNEAIASRRTSL